MQIVNNIIDFLKKPKNYFLHPLAKFLLKKGIKSNRITFYSLLTGIMGASLVFSNHELFIGLIIISVFLDILDGAVAKCENKSSKQQLTGWLYDRFSDRLVLAVILFNIFNHDISIIAGSVLGLYLLIKGWIIYENIVLKRRFEPIYLDRFGIILFIFEQYKIGLILILISLIINIFEILYHAYKLNKN